VQMMLARSAAVSRSVDVRALRVRRSSSSVAVLRPVSEFYLVNGQEKPALLCFVDVVMTMVLGDSAVFGIQYSI
jgi:hypothetical protein